MLVGDSLSTLEQFAIPRTGRLAGSVPRAIASAIYFESRRGTDPYIQLKLALELASPTQTENAADLAQALGEFSELSTHEPKPRRFRPLLRERNA